ncbi:folylpolyglutamate synthase/dihydrofolate synthase family protein [Phycisphaerales bacterium AB-hyl4]|uniref:Dihydrofolate synthase/folylpolyglutamate synthase n=1 Tax=Natronomicrosphaera hydrolytica TaxID=3242702 RepID=A0ABV4U3B6_9BACT
MKTATRGRSDAAASITNYTTALRWLYEHVDHERLRIVRYNERTFNLSRMRKLLELIGNPHEQLRCVQVAGTKGKGSTCSMLARMLQEAGYGVGLYTSPHLVDLRERITVNGQMIAYNDAAEAFKLIASVEDKFGEEPPTFFEIMTAAALKHFADQAVDVAVLETGLGGRLDCTTVVDPLVTGITRISLDHTNILGNKLEEIAREKAGIFKKDVPAVSVEQTPEVEAVLREVAEEVGTTVEFTGNEIDFSYRFEANRELGPHTRVCVTTSTSKFEHLPVPLRGEHQAHNCGLALAMLDKLKGHEFSLPEEKIIVGLASTELHGRMEQVWTEPRIIIDGAHNAASITALIRALGAHISYDSLVMIFGCGQDKDVEGMLQQIALGADKVIFTRAKSNPRAVEPGELMTKFNEVSGKMAQTAPNLPDAIRLAARAVSREDLIVICGSFYIAGEARKYCLDAQSKRQRR